MTSKSGFVIGTCSILAGASNMAVSIYMGFTPGIILSLANVFLGAVLITISVVKK